MKPDTAELWVRYKEHQEIESRDALIVYYAYLVKYVANRLIMHLSTVAEMDELLSYGIEGLIDAIEKFDHQRNIKFETYAVIRIRGSILDGLRGMDWAPVSLRQKSKELEKAYARLEAELGRAATDEEIAAELGLTINELGGLLREVAATTVISLDDILPGGEEDNSHRPLIDMLEDQGAISALEMVELAEIKEMLAKAISRLPYKEKNIIYMYYYEGLTLKEIGATLSLSESRISQLHTKAVLRLRGSLGKKKKLMF